MTGSSLIDQPRAERDGEALPRETLKRYLASMVGLDGELEIRQFRGGHSNLTYLLRVGDRELVLRRPPFGSKVKSAHDMGREYRVLSALAPHLAKAPRPIAHCDDESVIGAPFYLMEPVRGLIIRRSPPAELTLDPPTCRALSETMIDTLAELHAVDFKAIDLGDLGRPAGYVERQVLGWTKRYEKAKTDDIAEADRVAAWLEEKRHTVGDGERAALIHNDFKFDNLVLDPDDLSVVRGVLDWEMCTIGDPWMDLGTALCYWVEPGDPLPVRQLAFGPTTAEGMLTRRELIARYEEKSGAEVVNPLFFYVFGLFKIAGVVQQIYYRYAQGLTSDDRFRHLGGAARVLLQQADAAIESEKI